MQKKYTQNKIFLTDYPYLDRIELKLRGILIKLEKLKNPHRMLVDKINIFDYLREFGEQIDKMIEKLDELK